MPIVGVGTKEAYLALCSDDKREHRFAPCVLPLWQAHQELASLLVSFLAELPLRSRSDAAVLRVLRYLLDKTDTVVEKPGVMWTCEGLPAYSTGSPTVAKEAPVMSGPGNIPARSLGKHH